MTGTPVKRAGQILPKILFFSYMPSFQTLASLCDIIPPVNEYPTHREMLVSLGGLWVGQVMLGISGKHVGGSLPPEQHVCGSVC